MAHILIIDDDPAIQSVFSQLIEHLGHQTTLAQNGKEGLKVLEAEPPDLVITDIMMPEMDGLELIPRIRDYAPALPIIAISGGMKGSLMNFLPIATRFGACKVLEKPISMADLKEAVEELLSGGAD